MCISNEANCLSANAPVQSAAAEQTNHPAEGERRSVATDCYAKEVSPSEDIVLYSIHRDKLHLPSSIEPRDAIKLYRKYFPKWEQTLLECMEIAMKNGELSQDDEYGIAILNFSDES